MATTFVPADDLRSIEHSTLKVPYETLNKQYRNVQKSIDRECSSISQQLNQLDKLVKTDFTKAEILNSLANIVEKLRILKRKSHELRGDEKDYLKLIKRRIDHLKEHDSNTLANLKLFKKQRMDRMLIDYFLRSGFYNTAQLLANKSNILELTNIDVFLTEKDIIDSLISKDTSKCLVWCNENKSKLKKINSNLEFTLHQQEFIELIRAQKCVEAVFHARKYFVGLTPQQLGDVKKTMVLLVYAKSSEASSHDLLSENRWDQIIELFKTDNYKIHQLPAQSSFTAVLQWGLSSLKTPTCFKKVQATKNLNCPICQPNLNTISKQLPYANCSNSKLICSYTGASLNENNVPMMLPNGYVYGYNTLLLLLEENNGKIKCPRTNDLFEFHEAQKVFIL